MLHGGQELLIVRVLVDKPIRPLVLPYEQRGEGCPDQGQQQEPGQHHEQRQDGTDRPVRGRAAGGDGGTRSLVEDMWPRLLPTA